MNFSVAESTLTICIRNARGEVVKTDTYSSNHAGNLEPRVLMTHGDRPDPAAFLRSLGDKKNSAN